MSLEEDEMLETAVRLSGLTKQDYIISKISNRDVVFQGNPRVFKALKIELAEILLELNRIEAGNAIDEELLEVIGLITITLERMNGEKANGAD